MLRDYPEYDETVTCHFTQCREIEAGVLTGLYGMVGGGGMGAYTMCENCGLVLTKSFDPEEPCESHENVGHTDLMVSPEAIEEATKDVEIKDAEQAATDIQDARSNVDDGNGGSLPSPRE